MAGDSLEDANFERHTADAMILRLAIDLEWMQSMISGAESGLTRPSTSPQLFWDNVLEHRIREYVAAAQGRYKAYVSSPMPAPPRHCYLLL